jgi:hypothetical protein
MSFPAQNRENSKNKFEEKCKKIDILVRPSLRVRYSLGRLNFSGKHFSQHEEFDEPKNSPNATSFKIIIVFDFKDISLSFGFTSLP